MGQKHKFKIVGKKYNNICHIPYRSQLFSGFWIGWIVEHPTKSYSKISKKLDVQPMFNVKNPIMFYGQSLFNVKNPKKLDFRIGFF
jgi:hypothetical protein